MKCKIFSGGRRDAVEKQADGWLATRKPNFELHHSETRMDGPATVTLWYDVAREDTGRRPHAGRSHRIEAGHGAAAI